MKSNRWSIRWNLFAAFVAFLIFVLVLIWTFQVGFLDSFYKGIKKQNVERTAQQVINKVERGEGLSDLEAMAYENEFHIRVVSDQGVLISESVGVPSLLIQNIIAYQYPQLYQLASQNGGRAFLDLRNTGRDEYITYVAIANQRTMVIIQALIVPVSATVATLKVQLAIISVMLAGVALVFSWYMSRRLAKPLIQLQDEAKELGQATKVTPFAADGYSEVNALSETLNQAHQGLMRVDAMRKELLANISHDLKTPLTMIQGFGEIIRDIPDDNHEESANVIIEEARHLSRLVDDLLELSKLEEGMGSLALSVFDGDQLVNQVLQRYQNVLLKDKTIIKEGSSQAPLVGDDNKLHQVLYNLINNAIQHGGDTVVVRIHDKASTVLFEVIDNGPGLDEETKATIWERYVKSTVDHSRASIGSGIGLAICKHVLSLHQVPFGVNSELGAGSTFWFELQKKKED